MNFFGSRRLPNRANGSANVSLIPALLLAFTLCPAQANPPSEKNESATGKYHLVWVADPATEAVVGWNQIEGEAATVYYGPEDLGREAEEYPEHAACDRVFAYDGMTNCFACLNWLKPVKTTRRLQG